MLWPSMLYVWYNAPVLWQHSATDGEHPIFLWFLSTEYVVLQLGRKRILPQERTHVFQEWDSQTSFPQQIISFEPDRGIDVLVVEMIFPVDVSRGTLKDSSEQYWRHIGWSCCHERVRRSRPTNRGVDLLLSEPDDYLSRSLASIHMIFHFDRRSGLLMLKGGSHKVPVEYKLGDKWTKLEYDEEHLIYEPSIRIRVGVCEYELEHTVEEKYRAFYFDKRDRLLEAQL